MFSRSAMRGRSLCGLTGIPLDALEGEIHLVLLALLFELFSQDAEHEDVAILAVLVGRLAENPLQVKSMASQGIGAQQVVLVDLGLDPPEPADIHAIG